MAQRIQLRRGTAAEWAAANPVLAVGEPGVETDTGKQKFGDGVTPWNSRPYASKGDTGPVGPPNTDASLLATGTVPDGRLPVRLSDSQLSATYGTVLVYSGGAYPARPAGAVSVAYIGPVQPTTWQANDTWKDNS